MFFEYIFIFYYIFLLSAVFILLFLISFLFVFQKPTANKTSAYECGFNPFSDARVQFEIKFYLIGILFIIFDIEISFSFPWIIALDSLPLIGVVIMFLFIIILTIGFIYEWNEGALDW
jgi:NADH:ubiquinone oxidoreductase subunit 3 (subunit A)